MGFVEGVRSLDRRLERLVERQRPFLQPMGQRFAFEVLHDEERRAVLLADIKQRANVRVIKPRDRASFTVEALAELRIAGEALGQDLDRDGAIEPRVARLVDLAL